MTFLGLLIPFFPLMGFLINGLLGKYLPVKSAGWIGSAAILASFACVLFIAISRPTDHTIPLTLFDWIQFGNVSIPFHLSIDSLTVVMMLVVTGVGFLIHVYSNGYMHDDKNFRLFFVYLNLFIFFMLLLVMGGNYLVMFIGWEGVGLCSYLLIGFWYQNREYNDAAQKAFVMNRIGDLGFLLGLFFLLFHFGTLDISIIGGMAPELGQGNQLLVWITLLLFVGAIGKSAQIPLYTWLPDAMAGPTPVSALIHAATMVTAGVYMVVRSNVLFALAPFSLSVVLWIGIATSLLAAFIALKQNDIKKVLAYSTVSQLGLMFAALGLGAFTSGMFHVVTHAFFKALLFLGAGSVIHALHGEQDIRQMGGLKKLIPITYITFLLASLAISGFPLLSGFFSKDEILAHAFQENIAIWIILSFSSLLTAFYMFRLVYLTFFNDFRGTEETRKHIHESPGAMTFPLIVLCVLSVLGGIIGLPHVFHVPHLLAEYLAPVTDASRPYLHGVHHLSAGLEIGLMAFAGLAAIGVIWFAYLQYVQKQKFPAAEAELTGWQKWAYHKFYVDELYHRIFVFPAFKLSGWFSRWVDRRILDRSVNGTGAIINWGGKTLRLMQSGNTGFYLFVMVSGVIVLMILRLLVA